MVAKYFAELCIAMFLTGIEIQTPADFISKSTIIILQNFCLPTYLFFALQITTEKQMLALTDWGTNSANKKAYNVFTSIIGKDLWKADW